MVKSDLNRDSLGVKLRSVVFNIVFYVNLVLFLVAGSWLLLAPRDWAMAGLRAWAQASLWWLKVICGLSMEVRGKEHLIAGACLCAGKHQSAWETFALVPVLRDPAIVLKRELAFIPLFGWFALKFRMITLNRSAGPQALKGLIGQARKAAAGGREVVIFPEGTRKAPDAPPEYKPGAAALYLGLELPCVPFALNSGHFWPRRSLIRRPGKVILEFLPPIPPGLPRREFQARLESQVEAATARLAAAARA
jgi:1-acyl-sn-glycerol-3-phosphate acyltransferase